MKKRFYEDIIAMTLLFITLIAIISAISMILNISKYKNAEYYVIGNDRIPSMTKVVGKRKLSIYRFFTEDGIQKYKYKYINVKDVAADLSNYTNELKDKYNFVYTSDVDLSKNESTIELSSNSVSKDEIIVVEINYKKNKYEIIISKGKGRINLY